MADEEEHSGIVAIGGTHLEEYIHTHVLLQNITLIRLKRTVKWDLVSLSREVDDGYFCRKGGAGGGVQVKCVTNK